jgi:hydrogenase maturation protease
MEILSNRLPAPEYGLARPTGESFPTRAHNAGSLRKREILAIGYGNELRRDDGLGPKLAREIEQLHLARVRVLVCHQLTPELADPVSQAGAVLFMDASLVSRRVELRRLCAKWPSAHLGHASEPSDLLNAATILYGRVPTAWLLALPAFDLAFGDGLSKWAEEGKATALVLFQRLWRFWSKQ